MKRKFQTYYGYGEQRTKGKIIEAETLEIAIMKANSTEPYPTEVEEIVEYYFTDEEKVINKLKEIKNNGL